ncbi:BRCA2-interacting transcriptional repressor EMSY [Dendroctonus ponderosae]|nr:BRCA2-interacting transcriptional repressor EMSY [Dendroctonus ponderosae]
MWPMLLDMTEEESMQSLRHLELEAYASLVSALRAQGSLNQDKRKILKETSIILNISNDRHKAEVRRAISDEKLQTIAYHSTGRLESFEDWAQEGRRLVPLLPRTPPQTSYSVVADDASDAAVLSNKQLPLPAHTERKRPLPQSVNAVSNSAEANGKSGAFRVPDIPKDDVKRRKCHSVGETSSLAQHLLGPKLTKIQQLYRQASKPAKLKSKDTVSDIENTDLNKSKSTGPELQPPASLRVNSPKSNLQQFSISYSRPELATIEEKTAKEVKPICTLPLNETQAPVLKSLTVKPEQQLESSRKSPVVVEQLAEPVRPAIPKKTISIGQKVIVVSNAQTIPTNSILQKTLSVPMNKLTKFSLDKFKILPNNQLPARLSTPVTNHHMVTSKPKMVTIKGTANKKMIPLSQLHILNPKTSLKVIPFSGKIEDNGSLNNSIKELKLKRPPPIPDHALSDSLATGIHDVNNVEIVKTETCTNGTAENGAALTIDELEANMDDFRISRLNCDDLENIETLSSDSGEMGERDSNGGSNIETIEIDDCEFLDTEHNGEIMQEFEVIHTEEILE